MSSSSRAVGTVHWKDFLQCPLGVNTIGLAIIALTSYPPVQSTNKLRSSAKARSTIQNVGRYNIYIYRHMFIFTTNILPPENKKQLSVLGCLCFSGLQASFFSQLSQYCHFIFSYVTFKDFRINFGKVTVNSIHQHTH